MNQHDWNGIIHMRRWRWWRRWWWWRRRRRLRTLARVKTQNEKYSSALKWAQQRNSRTAVETEIDCCTKTKTKMKTKKKKKTHTHTHIYIHSLTHRVYNVRIRNIRMSEPTNEWMNGKKSVGKKNARTHILADCKRAILQYIVMPQFDALYVLPPRPQKHTLSLMWSLLLSSSSLIQKCAAWFLLFMQWATMHWIDHITHAPLFFEMSSTQHFISSTSFLITGWSAIHKRNRAKRKT